MPIGSEKPVAPKKLIGFAKLVVPSVLPNWFPKFAVLNRLKPSKKA